MNLIILGPPGSGKGTQAKMLAEKLSLYHFQTGEFSRNLAKRDPRIKKIVDSGKLIPEQEMTSYVSKYLEEKVPDAEGILFEGYPRFITQHEYLKGWMQSKGRKINAVILLDISEKEAIRRLSARRICEQCGDVYNLITNPPPGDKCRCGGKLIQREDDGPKSIIVRFKYYKDNTKKLIDYVEKKGNLIRVDGERPIKVIFEDIMARLKVDEKRN
ncbi:nucleoside monophosphate kinase [Candidatus Woesebacteria bacterium]|nr:nucleoside monophosphate kinase [Candidatus Woesebacteria bacterium]